MKLPGGAGANILFSRTFAADAGVDLDLGQAGTFDGVCVDLEGSATVDGYVFATMPFSVPDPHRGQGGSPSRGRASDPGPASRCIHDSHGELRYRGVSAQA